MRRRTRARELALQFLYQLDVRGPDIRADLEEFLKESGASRMARRFATEIVNGVLAHRDELDAIIVKVAQNWTLSRMPPVDRNILRLASYELLHCEDIPVGVAMNEAIELGKRYSTANSGSFINGILDHVKEGRPFEGDAPRAPAEHDEEEEFVPPEPPEPAPHAPPGATHHAPPGATHQGKSAP
jgi:transcription antitermination factor NusB